MQSLSEHIQQWLNDFRNNNKELLNNIYIYGLQEKIFSKQNYKYAQTVLQQLLKEHEPSDKEFKEYINRKTELDLWEILNDVEVMFNKLYLYYKLMTIYKDIIAINKKGGI